MAHASRLGQQTEHMTIKLPVDWRRKKINWFLINLPCMTRPPHKYLILLTKGNNKQDPSPGEWHYYRNNHPGPLATHQPIFFPQIWTLALDMFYWHMICLTNLLTHNCQTHRPLLINLFLLEIEPKILTQVLPTDLIEKKLYDLIELVKEVCWT